MKHKFSVRCVVSEGIDELDLRFVCNGGCIELY
jgi:hypothetical protein